MEKEESGYGFTNVKHQLYATIIGKFLQNIFDINRFFRENSLNKF